MNFLGWVSHSKLYFRRQFTHTVRYFSMSLPTMAAVSGFKLFSVLSLTTATYFSVTGMYSPQIRHFWSFSAVSTVGFGSSEPLNYPIENPGKQSPQMQTLAASRARVSSS